MDKRFLKVKLGGVLAAVLAANACATGGQTSSTYAAPMVPAAAPETAAASPASDPVVQRIAQMQYDIPYTKYVLKKALNDRVPQEILRRRKAGFPVPFGRWLRHELKPWLHDVLLDRETLARGYFERSAVEALIARNAKDAVICEATIVYVTITPEGKPMPVPDEWRAIFSPWE